MSDAIDDLVEPMTADEVRESFYAVLALVGVSTTNWRPGAVVRTIITVCAIIIAACTSMIAAIARGGFIETAQDAWKRLVAKQHYGVDVIDARQAETTCLLSNSSGNLYDFDADDLIAKSRITGKTFRNVDAVSVGSGASNIECLFRAVEVGSASTAFAGEIDSFETPFDGLTITNPAAAIGFDEEDPQNLQSRCYERLGALSPNGPADAYAFVCRSALRADGSPIGITRVRHTKDGYGNVHTYVATAAGAVGVDDIAILADAVSTQVEPQGVASHVHSADEHVIDVSYRVWIYNTISLSASQIRKKINAAIASFLSVQPIGGNTYDVAEGRVFASGVQAAIGGAVGPEAFRIEVTLGDVSGDAALGAFEVPKLGTITELGLTLVAPGSATVIT